MPDVLDLLTQLVGDRPSPLFATLLVVHIAAGLTAVVAGATAMLSPKRSGRHPKAGRTYYVTLCVVCATAAGMAAMRWPEDAYLVVLGSLSLAAATLAYLARHFRWQGWIPLHILGMGTSYIVLMTAFYVDNGPRLPVWDRLPLLAFWIVPTLIGFPLVVRARGQYRGGLHAPPIRVI
jgi:cytochrome c oxidase subunit IV